MGTLRWEYEQKCMKCGISNLKGKTMAEHQLLCRPEKEGVTYLACPACTLACKSKFELAKHVLACIAPMRKLDQPFVDMVPTYEPEIKGPAPMMNWMLKSEKYRRPKIISWLQMANTRR